MKQTQTMAARSTVRAKYIAERARIRNMLLRKRRQVPAKDAICVENCEEKTCLELRNWASTIPYNSIETVAARGFLSLVRILLDRGVVAYTSAINQAASYGYIKIVWLLIDYKVPIDAWTIHWAAKYGHIRIVRGLLDREAPINDYAISRAAKKGHIEIVQLLLDRKAPITTGALWYAAAKGHIKIVQLLIDHNAPIGEENLQYAARFLRNTKKDKAIAGLLTAYAEKFREH